VASIGNNFVGGFALDMTNEAYTAGVSLVFWGVETLLGWEGRAPRVWITGDAIECECVDDDGGIAVCITVGEAGVVGVAVAIVGNVLSGEH
jgi:hypothetical protein